LQIPCTEGGKQKKLQGGILKDFFAWGKEKLAYFAGVKQNPPTLQGGKDLFANNYSKNNKIN
jgi:hypothetical protein